MPTKAHRLDLSGLANMRTVRSVRIRMPAIEREREENGKRKRGPDSHAECSDKEQRENFLGRFLSHVIVRCESFSQ